MELAKRKNTTEQGLKELKILIDGFSFCSDINSVESGIFFSRIEKDNGCQQSDYHYVGWTNTDAKWKISDGEIKLMSINAANCCSEYSAETARIEHIDQLNFRTCVDALHEVIERYNIECVKKDEQIETFLVFCENYKKPNH